MRKNQRFPYDYPKSRKYIIEDISAREKVNEELKSLQCSSVQEVQQTNQSYEMSWLEKLVNNMDDESKHANSYHEQINRNFSRKSSTGNHASLVDGQKSIQSYSRPRSTFSGTKNENKNYQYTPYSKISQKYQQYGMNSLKKDDNQRIHRDCFNSMQKYEANKKYVGLEGPPIKKQQYRTHQIKDIDLNQSSQSYGRIKKVNKYKQQLSNKPGIQKMYLSRPSNSKDNRKQRFITEESNTRKLYNLENLQTQSTNRIANVTAPRRNEDLNAFRRRSTDYNILIEDNSYNNHKNIDSLTKLHMKGEPDENIEKGIDKPRQKDLQKKYLREEDFKMDQMAKKLNEVLQNISRKSKLISQNNNEQKKTTKKDYQPQSIILLKDNTMQQKLFQKYGSDLYINKQQKSKQTAYSYNRPSTDSGYEKRTVNLTEKQINHERSWEKEKGKFIKYHQSQPKEIQTLSKAYPNSYHRPDQRQLIRQKSIIASKFPYSYQKPFQTQKYDQKIKYASHSTPAQTQQKNKYQMMKKSLGMSKHIPQEIILEESSSEINSQISPRTEFLNREFKAVFQNLDKNGIGELSRSNCDVESVNDEIKYLFGGILSRIKYKNERVSVKTFMEQCQNISKQFQFQQLKQVLNKQKKITNFKLNEKDTQSERWNNNTNYESESKRSSDRSEVVKKYQFIEDKKDTEKIIKINQKNDENRQKVHWAAKQYSDLAGRCQNFKTGFQNEKFLIRRQKMQQKESPLSGLTNKKQKVKKSQNESEIDDKQNVKSRPQLGKEKKNFEKMCENLNNKLNNYLTTIKQKEISGHHISLQFSELSKHLSSK